ncbi:hypothetical protein ACQPXB_00925 [Amycolatopsis sp. CA-161197]|uniref:hypothetical protein n=1 Tax=Amycolatopsis sp. CA-161197 TaxID=3239922 RepID=UPI003D8F3799
MPLFRCVFGTFALVAGITVVWSAAAQAEPENPAGAIPETSISPFGDPFLVASGALLAAAASAGMVLHLRRRPA